MADAPERLTVRQAAVAPLGAAVALGGIVVALAFALSLDGLRWLWLLTIWAAFATAWTRRRGLGWPRAMAVGALAVGTTLLAALVIFAFVFAAVCPNGCML